MDTDRWVGFFSSGRLHRVWPGDEQVFSLRSGRRIAAAVCGAACVPADWPVDHLTRCPRCWPLPKRTPSLEPSPSGREWTPPSREILVRLLSGLRAAGEGRRT